MAADATAASVYQGLVKNADPIGAYAMGVQVRAKLEAINAAVPAEIFQNTMNLMKLADARSDRQQRAQLAAKELEIATYNAETNRINANRPRTSTQTGAGGGFNILSALRTDADGVYLDPSALTGQGAQMPTSGEGDSGEVAPLTPTMGDGTPRVLGDASSGMLTLPQAGQDPGVTPLLPSPQGAAPRASAPAAGGGKLRLGGVTINAKGQPSLSFKAPDSADAPNVLAAPQFLDSLNKQYAHLGVKAVPKADKNGFDFVQAESLSGVDFSISSLPAETQKGFLEDVTTMIQDAAEIENPSDVEKMRAAGVVLPDNPTPAQISAAGAQMQSEGRDWNAAYAAVKKDKENDLLSKASTYAKKLNAQFAGKVGKGGGYVPRSGIDVLREIGITELQPQQAQPTQQQGAPASAGQVPMASAANAPQASAQPTGGNDDIIATTRQQLAAETNPKARLALETRLKSLEQAKPSAPAAQGGAQTDVFTQISEDTARRTAAPANDAKKQASNQRWEAGKQTVLSTMVKGGVDIAELKKPAVRSQERLFGSGGEPTSRKKLETWVEQNRDKLPWKDKDGGELTLESVVFNDGERDVTLQEVITSALNDPRTAQALKAKSTTSHEASTGVKYSVGTVKEVK